MYYGMYVSAAGAHALSKQVETLSNNLANVDTSGFKRNLSILEARDSEAIERGLVSPGGRGLDDIGGGVRLLETPTDFSLGVIRQTHKDTDFALDNPLDFFMVQRGEEQFLTRAGAFHFSADGRLQTESGDNVLGADGAPIQINPLVDWKVHNGGMIEQAGTLIPLGLRRAANGSDVMQVGDNFFTPRNGTLEPVPDNERSIRSGFLERSSVQPTREMVDLIAASRAYEANVRLIQQGDSLVGALVGRILRV